MVQIKTTPQRAKNGRTARGQDVDGEIAGPTPERLKQAANAFELGGDRRDRVRVYRMRDAPLERLHAEHKLSGVQYAALGRYRRHWFGGNFNGVLRSVDPDRVYAVDYTSMTGLARTYREAEHRDEYRLAREALQWRWVVVEGVACHEIGLEQIGLQLGFKSPFWARGRVQKFLCEAADMLSSLWQIG